MTFLFRAAMAPRTDDAAGVKAGAFSAAPVGYRVVIGIADKNSAGITALMVSSVGSIALPFFPFCSMALKCLFKKQQRSVRISTLPDESKFRKLPRA